MTPTASTEPPPSALRHFGLGSAAILGSLGLFGVWRGHTTSPIVFLGAAALLAVLGIAAPRALGPVRRGWMALGRGLGWFNSHVILTLIYVTMFVPIRGIQRLFGYDALDRTIDRRRASYWSDVPRAEDRRQKFERQS